MFPHVFGAAAGDSKAIGGKDKLDLLFRSILRGVRPSNVFATGMSGSQPGETPHRRSKRLEEKRGGVIIQDLPRFRLNEGRRTASQTEGDVIVLSLEEPSPTRGSPREEAEC